MRRVEPVVAAVRTTDQLSVKKNAQAAFVSPGSEASAIHLARPSFHGEANRHMDNARRP